jgi:hypothetical protein
MTCGRSAEVGQDALLFFAFAQFGRLEAVRVSGLVLALQYPPQFGESVFPSICIGTRTMVFDLGSQSHRGVPPIPFDL